MVEKSAIMVADIGSMAAPVGMSVFQGLVSSNGRHTPPSPPLSTGVPPSVGAPESVVAFPSGAAASPCGGGVPLSFGTPVSGFPPSVGPAFPLLALPHETRPIATTKPIHRPSTEKFMWPRSVTSTQHRVARVGRRYEARSAEDAI